MLGSLIVAIFSPIAGINQTDAYVYHERVVSQEPIYSLETPPSVHGSFVLGIGKVESGAEYYFYIKDEYGGLKLINIDSDSCSIVETDKEKPSIKVIEKTPVFKSALYTFLYWPNLRALLFSPEEHYILYVPPNTIKKVYSGNINH